MEELAKNILNDYNLLEECSDDLANEKIKELSSKISLWLNEDNGK